MHLLTVHDFFSPQPVTNASIFLCRMVVHDYGKSKAITILRHLRHAAQVDTKLLLVEQVLISSTHALPIHTIILDSTLRMLDSQRSNKLNQRRCTADYSARPSATKSGQGERHCLPRRLPGM